MSIRDLHIEDLLRIARKQHRLLENYYVPNEVKIEKIKEFFNLVIQFEYEQIVELEQKGESIFIVLCEDIIRQAKIFLKDPNKQNLGEAKNLLNIFISIEDYLSFINELPWIIGRKLSGIERRNIKSKLRRVLQNLKDESGKPIRGTRVKIELCGSLARGYSDWKLINGGKIPKPTDFKLPKEYRLRSKTILKKIDAELNVPRDLKPYMSDVDFVIVNEKIFNSNDLNKNDLYWFKLPSEDSVESNNIKMAKWSYFEPWDSYRNYLIAKKYCGLKESDINNSGTFTNFAQNDQALYSLHAYMMYLKFGFGRATQDAGIEIRRGAMDRDQAINLVNLYDGHYPEEFIETYLDYYQMTLKEFNFVIDKWTNKDLFEKINGRWKSKFNIK